MAPITKAQIQRLYALGAGIGIVERDNKEDDFHSLIFKHTGKTSTSDLTASEYVIVETELFGLMRYGSRTAPMKRKPSSVSSADSFPQGKPVQSKKASDDVPGMMTSGQQSKAWKLMYELISLDDGDKSRAGERMRGAIKKILGIDASLQEPFCWVDFKGGNTLIEKLKMYISSAKKRAAKKEAAG